MSYIIVLTTVPNNELAQHISDKLLSDGVAACVSFSQIFSHYKWCGKVEKESEIELKIKTEEKFYRRVEEIIKSLHTYEIPQIIAIPIVIGSDTYFEWLDKSLKVDK